MSAPAVGRPSLDARAGVDSRTLVAGAVAVVGCGVLAARPTLVAFSPFAAATLGVLFVGVLVLGAWLPLPAAASSSRPSPRVDARTTALVVLIGVLAFAGGRWIIGGRPPAPATAFLILANTLAAVAEEAWFRRMCFGLLAPAGTVMAVAGSTILFAAVHVSIYGYWVLPLDLAAGLLLGWQRATTGSWAAPAITHIVANLLVVL